MGEKMKRFLQKQSDKEADDILAQINADPEMANVHAPEEMEEALFARIDAYEKENAHRNLSEEDKELIELGKAYKRHKKRRKFTAVASLVLVGVMVSGITAMGGPEKVVEKLNWMLDGRDQTNVSTESERIEQIEAISEEEAFGQIEQEFGFTLVKMYYVPEGMVFQGYLIEPDTQYINLLYKGESDRIISIDVLLNYKMGSHSSDIEDVILEEYKKEIEDVEVSVKRYSVEKNGEERWSIDFQKDNIYYFIHLYNLDKEEVKQITDNLYFHN